MEYYKDHSVASGHFARLCNNVVDGVDASVVDSAALFSRIAEEEVRRERDWEEDGRQRQRDANLQERVEWQDSFDRRLKQLLTDFELSEVPSCRLNHLDRMHSWFT